MKVLENEERCNVSEKWIKILKANLEMFQAKIDKKNSFGQLCHD